VSLALVSDGNLISEQERQTIEAEIAQLKVIAKTEDATAINRAVDSLNQTTEAFAAARMNASVSRALTGKELNTLDI
jgi:molecular chaperone HscA